MSNIKDKKNKYQKGIAVYFTLVVLAVLTASLLSVLAISISQTRIVYALGDSIIAFYAADTGAEKVLYEIYKQSFDPQLAETCQANNNLFPDDADLVNAEYAICVDDEDDSKIYSTGRHKLTSTSRKIQISIGY